MTKINPKIRAALVEDMLCGMGPSEAAQKHGVSKAYVSNVRQQEGMQRAPVADKRALMRGWHWFWVGTQKGEG